MTNARLLPLFASAVSSEPVPASNTNSSDSHHLRLSYAYAEIVYLVLRLKKQDMYLRRTATFDVQAAFRRRKLVWVIWVVFITVSILYNTSAAERS